VNFFFQRHVRGGQVAPPYLIIIYTFMTGWEIEQLSHLWTFYFNTWLTSPYYVQHLEIHRLLITIAPFIQSHTLKHCRLAFHTTVCTCSQNFVASIHWTPFQHQQTRQSSSFIKHVFTYSYDSIQMLLLTSWLFYIIHLLKGHLLVTCPCLALMNSWYWEWSRISTMITNTLIRFIILKEIKIWNKLQ